MLHFFRKIRKKLADDNQFLKYARYAIGEIVLVVIGILIALQINNWNENRKQKLNDTKFLVSLHHEIEIDTMVFTDKIESYERINKSHNKTLQILNRPNEIDDYEHQLIVKSIQDIEVLTPSYKNIERNDVKLAEGTLEYIDNELNKKFQSYLETIKSNNDIVTKFGEALQFVVLEDIYPTVDLDYTGLTNSRVHYDLEILRKDRLFKNAINRSINYRNISIRFMIRQKKQAKELLEILNEKIN